ncbi:ThuA domain-containing protein [Histidinibacterium aquaticum]|uniref:ThuA domain-containing protein n=1 Tax=Histidinibacterium aquaticum TaxID=2613962 RepID=A0A5J5GM69_9RHOB|nr:ThuA domain-containing protein [Histidinibacterium aquaticum]KAA9009391.1 ThuA domain-containing protein [Histidinibacterium aquaticum]
MKAALFVGGWEGHRPTDFSDWCRDLLTAEGVEVVVHDTLEPLASPEEMRDVDVIVPIWSSARSSHQPEFGNMTKEQEDGLLELVGSGCGIAGWHGHMGDAFRDHPTYHFMIGGQFVGHPPGWPDNPIPSDDFVDYDVTITKPDHPLVEGIGSFRLKSEQYYMLVDPSNEVLATTTFSGEHLWWIEGTVIPVVWTRRWDKGRVFYCSIGHTVEDLQVPQVTEIIRRGILWAGGR